MTINEIRDKLKETGYIPTDDICYAVFGMLALNKPLLVEGAPGVGKTSLAKALAEVMGLPMLRLQMYDGLTKDEVLYDYDYQRQLLTLEAVKPKLNEEIKDLGINDAIKHVAGDVDFYGKEFLIPRPVLQTIDGSGRKLLLIDEIDKASEETEYMLYEYLEDYSIDIPQFGTVSCPEDQKPVVILTSNAYRELSGAMKRRCSYLYIKKKTRAEIIEVFKYRTSVDERVASEIYSVLGRMGEVDIKRLLYAMIVHSSDQSEEFDPLYGEFVSFFFQKEKERTAAREAADKAREDSEKATKEHEEEVARIQEKIRQLNDKKEKLQAEKRKVLEEQNKKEIAKAEKTAKKQEKVRNLKACLKGLESLSGFVACVRSGERPEQEKLAKEIKEASLRACTKSNSAELLKEIREIGRQLKAIKDKETSVDERIEKNDWELCRSADDLKRQEREFKKKLKQIAKQQKEIYKDKPVESRKETLRVNQLGH